MVSEGKKSTGITVFGSQRTVTVIFHADSAHTNFFSFGELVWCCHYLLEFFGYANLRSQVISEVDETC
jgi:hypothetical protein